MIDDVMNRFGSEPFRFLVDGKPIYMHKTLVANVSKPLDRLINGPMSEAQSGEAELEEVDGLTFTRFCQWAYAGFYPAAEFGDRPQDVALAEQTAGPTSATPPTSLSPPMRIRKHTSIYVEPRSRTVKETMKESFLELQFCKPADEGTALAPRANSAPSEDYTNIFLSHAHVYVFAEKFDVQPLKRLALKNLHQTLAIFTLWPECVGDIVALARFVYNQTSEPVDGAEPMRSMLKRYIGYEMDVLIRAAGFLDLLEEHRELLNDFCSMVGERIK